MIESIRTREKRCERVGSIARLDSYGGREDDGVHGFCDRVDVGKFEDDYVAEELWMEAYEIAREIHDALVKIQWFRVGTWVGYIFFLFGSKYK